jgi:D-serine deaminase-like pyridoxal phosphate-dependent protein
VAVTTSIYDLPTPALLLDIDVLEDNLSRMAERAKSLGVALRPHIKTHKCIEIGERQRSLGATGVTVSTLYEANVFADHRFDDITWAFPLILGRIDEVRRLSERVALRVVVDSADAAATLESTGKAFQVLLEVDCGYHRAGLDPMSRTAVELARHIHDSPTLMFDGILTHSGHAYAARSPQELAAVAAQERDVMVAFAEKLRTEGIDVERISIGSTPAVSVVDHLEEITEIRPGNYAFYDYTQVLLGAATPGQCALTVLASVVSSQPGADHCVVDAGALALSKDSGRGNAPQPTMGEIYEDYSGGALEPDVRLVYLSQEHGIVNASLPVGSKIRILPNHACLTAACFDQYYVVKGEEVVDRWKIWRGR